jgi:hypothetical protein
VEGGVMGNHLAGLGSIGQDRRSSKERSNTSVHSNSGVPHPQVNINIITIQYHSQPPERADYGENAYESPVNISRGKQSEGDVVNMRHGAGSSCLIERKSQVPVKPSSNILGVRKG